MIGRIIEKAEHVKDRLYWISNRQQNIPYSEALEVYNFINDQDKLFISSFNTISNKILCWANNKGWDVVNQDEGKTLMLIVSELAEGLEGLRKDLQSDHIPNYKMIEEELADTIIRIMHYAIAKKYKVAEALIDKMKFNETRSYKHGNKKF